MKDRKPTNASVDKENLPIAFAMLFTAFETTLTHIAEQGDDDWHRGLYERIQRQLDDLNALITAASQLQREDIPRSQSDMPEGVRAGSAAVDAAFDSVIAKMARRGDRNTGT